MIQAKPLTTKEKLDRIQLRHHYSEINARVAARKTAALLTSWAAGNCHRKEILALAQDDNWLIGQAKAWGVSADHTPLMCALVKTKVGV